ncbi:hypothetical protein Tco_0000509 [Tanacetum coccineum]
MIDQGVTATLAVRDANRNGDDSHTSGTGGRRTERIVRECTYQDFMKMETVFRISNCPMENQVKFSTCTLLAGRSEEDDLSDKEVDQIERYVGGFTDMDPWKHCSIQQPGITCKRLLNWPDELMDKKVIIWLKKDRLGETKECGV